MVLQHYRLREQPFGVTPDPRYLYASATHREALSSLLYGIESGLGFVALTAQPGMGKTTLLFEVLNRMQDTAKTVFLFQTISTPDDLVRALLIDLGVKEIAGNLTEMQAQLNSVLVAQCATGKRLLVAIDEAQNLSDSVLEAVRMLSNFETSRQKLMQIVLAGQLQLAEKLASPQLLQLRQRISIFAHLEPLSAKETTAYIHHRLLISCYASTSPLFTNSALALIARHSEGVPRNINNLCFNALSLGCALGSKTIDADIIKEVVADLDLSRFEAPGKVAEPPVEEENSNTDATSKPARVIPALRIVAGVAVACVILLLFGWLARNAFRAATTDSSGNELRNVAPSPAPQSPVAPKLQQPVASSVLEAKVVEVREGQSLYDICVENFGECRPPILEEMIHANSSIHDPNHVVPGQRVKLPALPQISTASK